MVNTLENDKRTIRGWALFDAANSSYALVISVAIFPNYYIRMTDDTIDIIGVSITNSSLYAFSLSSAYLIIAALLPFLSGIADYSGRRMLFLKFFTWLGSIACLFLFLFDGPTGVSLALLCFILATIGFDGGKVFYNSYLPIITTEEHYDKVSAQGFAYGYFGSIFLLIFNLVMILQPQWFGINDDTLAVRISFVSVGLWWISLAQISFRRLPSDLPTTLNRSVIKKGYQEIRSVWKALRPQKNLKRFLVSFFCYSAGVQTILYLAATFAEKELSFGTSELIILIIILQVVAIAGAYLFASLSKHRGNKISLMTMLFIWLSICLLAFLVVEKNQFYLIAILVGLVMGGIQSMSRSTYSKLISDHTEERTSYFSFYEVLEKLAIVFGTLSFGLIDNISGGMRNSILVLGIYFLVGIFILSKVKWYHPPLKASANA
ncbi:MAG: MFS transporter [Saprospiraceae bacterium]|nr:MFS transporter [Saprospiraceae bacterium]